MNSRGIVGLDRQLLLIELKRKKIYDHCLTKIFKLIGIKNKASMDLNLLYNYLEITKVFKTNIPTGVLRPSYLKIMYKYLESNHSIPNGTASAVEVLDIINYYKNLYRYFSNKYR